MLNSNSTSQAKRRTCLSISDSLLQEAENLKINISQSAENGIAEAVRLHKHQTWLKDNADAISSSNEFVSENGLPLSKFCTF